jgi:hypothetical protein
MSFVYPRTITITRPNTVSGIGGQGYEGLAQDQETTIVSGIAASIQERSTTRRPDARLPGDVNNNTIWHIYIKRSLVALGVIQDRDIVTDDLGNRFQVMGAYWNSLGYNLDCTKLQN